MDEKLEYKCQITKVPHVQSQDEWLTKRQIKRMRHRGYQVYRIQIADSDYEHPSKVDEK